MTVRAVMLGFNRYLTVRTMMYQLLQTNIKV